MNLLDYMDWCGITMAFIGLFLINPDNYRTVGMIMMTGLGLITTNIFLRCIGVVKE
jgi:hypothetical protein